MSDARPPARRSSGGLGQGASTQMAKTAGLVLLAIIIGVIMLNVIDDGAPSSANKPAATPTTKKPTTSTTKPGTKATTTTATAKPAAQLTPAQLRVIVLNAGSGVNKGASALSDELRAKGYKNQGTPGNTSTVQGVLVECRSGLDREAAALATATGHGAKVAPFPATPPAGVDSSTNCIVLRGKSST